MNPRPLFGIYRTVKSFSICWYNSFFRFYFYFWVNHLFTPHPFFAFHDQIIHRRLYHRRFSFWGRSTIRTEQLILIPRDYLDIDGNHFVVKVPTCFELSKFPLQTNHSICSASATTKEVLKKLIIHFFFLEA